MLNSNIFRSKCVGLIGTLSIFFLSRSAHVHAQNGLVFPPLKIPLAPLINPVKESQIPNGLSPLNAVPFPGFFKYTTTVDSTGKTVIITHRAYDIDFTLPGRISLQEYLIQRSKLENARLWKETVSKQRTSVEEQSRGGRGISIQTPKIKSKAFRRITGGETLSLNVTGDITIDGSMRNEKRSQKNLMLDRAPSTNFQMKQTQRFQVEGKIGNNISIRVDQDSERDFDFENAVKLDYTGDEDGIVQKIEAGNVALSLPATRFVTYSAQNSGLFGIKSQFKIGALDITAIASMEKAQKKKLSLTGGKEEQTMIVDDYEYKRNTYFFLDYYYRNHFTDVDPISRIHRYEITRSITILEVYKSDAMYENREGAISGWALADISNRDISSQGQERYKGSFIHLLPQTDYTVNKELGYIVLNNTLQESEVLAVAYRDSSGHVYGDLWNTNEEKPEVPIFKMIKPRNARPTDVTWNLEWKNVYSLGGRNLGSDFDFSSFRIYYKTSSGNPLQSWTISGKQRAFLDIFGLDYKTTSGSLAPDDILDNNPDIISLQRGELFFPDLKPFDPDTSLHPLPEILHSSAIYDTTVQDYIRKQSKFYMEFKSSSKSNNYNLGPYVVEESVEVLSNGTPLIKGTDYTLDAMFGNLTILKQDALSPSSNLEVRYESQQLFSVEKKSLLGIRAEYALNQNANQKSFIGGTFLYFNHKTMDQRIRVGSEGGPYRNMVWDVNTALNFQPNFLTRALDALPVVQATSPSTFTFEGEIAQVIPNPNTLNSKSTGDKDGVAYLDDFEGAKRQNILSIDRIAWSMSSPPGTGDIKNFLRTRGRFIWYNPYQQTLIQEIWPNRDVTTNYGGTNAQNIFTIKLTPNKAFSQPDSLLASWGGITANLSSGYADQTDSRFLEVWIKGDKGRLHFDLGQISEDIIPDGQLNTEDKKVNGIKNTILDEGEDTGIDGMNGTDPPSPFLPHTNATVNWNSEIPTGTPYDFWDLNLNGTKQSDEPWSYDDYSYNYNTSDYTKINGTENNATDGSVRYCSTEDINRNGLLDVNNDYFEFSFSLDKSSPDTVYKNGEGGKSSDGRKWYLYKIPLNKPTQTVGQPSWARIEYIRLWMDGLTQSDSCSIAEISLTGNEWKFQGTTIDSTSDYHITNDSTMTISVVNTHENPKYMDDQPPGVSGVIDPIYKTEAREQSLELNLNNLKPGETAVVEKQLYQSESIVNYRNLKMFVHGGNYERMLTTTDSIELFLRWGSDSENKDYYEVRMRVYPGWDNRNHPLVSFEELSRLKVELEAENLKSISENIPNGSQADHRISVVGKPSLTNVRWLMIGVVNMHRSHSFTGGVWVNELRISNVQKDRGMAMRARADLKLSDVFSINGEFTKQDADFHTVNERFGQGANSMSGSVNTSISIHKFLPSGWGLVIPVSMSYSRSLSTPKYKPNSDILIDPQTMPDSLLETLRNKTEQQGLNISFSKSSKSRNPFVRFLVDPLSSSMNYTKSKLSDPRTKYSNNNSIQGSLNYNLSLSGQYYIYPFKWLGNGGFFKKISQSRFYYLPSSLVLGLSGNQAGRNHLTREGIKSIDTTAGFTRRFSTNFKPLSILTFDYSRSYSADMRKKNSWNDLLGSLLSPVDTTSIDQGFSSSFDPKIFSFLSTSLRFSSNYRWNNNIQMISQGTSRSASIGRTISLNSSFDPSQFIQFFSRKKSSSQNTLAPRRDVMRKDGSQKQDTVKVKNNSFILLSFLKQTGSLFKKIQPITINVSQRDDRTDNGIVNKEPKINYQFGFPDPSDLGFDYSNLVASNRFTLRNDLTVSFQTSIRITSQLNVRLNYDFSNSENLSTQKTGSSTKSTYSLKDNIIPFPSWSVSWSGFEKLPLISKYFRTIAFSHNFSGKQTTTWNDSKSKITQNQTSNDFRPFAQFNLSLKNGMSGNVQYTKTESFSVSTSYGSGKTKNLSNSLSITAQYSKTGGIRLPFLKSKSLQNTLDFSMSFESSRNVQYQSQNNDTKFDDNNIVSDTKNWQFKPRLSYRFSNTVSGGTYLEMGKRSDKRIGSTSFTAFGINAAISLAGQ